MAQTHVNVVVVRRLARHHPDNVEPNDGEEREERDCHANGKLPHAKLWMGWASVVILPGARVDDGGAGMVRNTRVVPSRKWRPEKAAQ